MEAKVTQVFRSIVIVFSLALIACEQKSVVPENKFPVTKASCEEAQIPSQYLVRWNSGRITRLKAKNREEVISSTLKPFAESVQFIEPDFKIRLNQPRKVSAQINAEKVIAPANWGQVAIHAKEVWESGVTGTGITVAVIDTGADLVHTQLKNQLFINPKEIPDNGVDDDHNGFVDDVTGWDFVDNRNLVTDSAGHGTHVAGIILAEHAGTEVDGVAPGAKLLPMDFMNDDGEGAVGDAILAMQYAAAMGAKIINASWGASACSELLREEIATIQKKDVLLIAAAGNNGSDIGVYPEYPAAFNMPNQLTIGATSLWNKNEYLAGFSNYNDSLVHLVSPGQDIMSLFPHKLGNYERLSGTSMAAPFVSGVAALLWSTKPDAKAKQIRDAILNSVDLGPFAAVASSGRINAKKALDYLKTH